MERRFDLVLSIHHRVPLDRKDDEDVIQEYSAQIVIPNGGEDEVVAGTLQFYVVNVPLAAERGIDVVDVADSLDQDTLNYCSTLFQPGTAAELREEIIEQFEYSSGRVLLLHMAKVLPAFRGQNLGLVAAHRIIEQFGDGMVIAKAQPLQHLEERFPDEAMHYETFEQAPVAALKRLTRHWSKLGFEPIGDTGYMGLSTALRQPEPRLRSPSAPSKKRPPRSRKGSA